jgi:hypothetical protein
MDELVRMVSERTGISEDSARSAVQVVVGFLKDRLPAPITGQIDAVIGGSGAGDAAGGIAKGLGNILGQ